MGDSRLGQRHIDGCRVKHWAGSDENNLNEERKKIEWIPVQQDTRCISDNLDETPKDHEGHEAPASPADAEDDMDCDGEGEEGEEDGVCAE